MPAEPLWNFLGEKGYFKTTTSGLALRAAETMGATVDRIVFGKNGIDRGRLIDATVDMVVAFFDGRTRSRAFFPQ